MSIGCVGAASAAWLAIKPITAFRAAGAAAFAAGAAVSIGLA
jgi:hypothetical protein